MTIKLTFLQEAFPKSAPYAKCCVKRYSRAQTGELVFAGTGCLFGDEQVLRVDGGRGRTTLECNDAAGPYTYG